MPVRPRRCSRTTSMPTSRARLGQHPLRSTLGILVAVMLLGLATGTLGFLCSALTAQPLASKLGPPAANLSWYEGIPLELYLSLKEADLQAPSAQEAPINFEILAGDTGSAVAARLHGEAGWAIPSSSGCISVIRGEIAIWPQGSTAFRRARRRARSQTRWRAGRGASAS